MPQLRQATICFLVKEKDGQIQELLLAMKKKGFGQGKWNGAGGKFDAMAGDKNIEDTARRETKEEIGVKINNLEKVAVINFYFPEVSKEKNWDQQVIVYLARQWQGEPQESGEMAPRWFPVADLPYDLMWRDDLDWLPQVLTGKKVLADFFFQGQGEGIKEKDVKIVDYV